MVRNLSWQQIALVAILLSATFAAHRLLGLNAGMASGLVTTIVAFLLGRGDTTPPAGGAA